MREIVNVTRNYRVTISASIRVKAGLKESDRVRIEYEEEGIIKIALLKKKRTTIRLGRKISVEDIEEAVEGALDGITR